MVSRNVYQKFLNSYISYPKNVAVIDDFGKINYEDLFYSAYSLSLKISEKIGFNNKIPVVISAEKKIESIISIYAVIMSGNIYCPMDFQSNFIRTKKIIDNLNPGLIICNEDYEQLEDYITISAKNIKHEGITNDLLNNLMDDAAKIIDLDPIYIIFTSGSTGMPKGVTNTHAGVVDYVDWAQKTYEFSENDVFGNQAPLVFDNSTLDVFGSMNAGSSLLLINQNTLRFPSKTFELMNSKKVSVIFWVPSQYLLFQKTKAFDSGIFFKFLRWGLFAGEVMQSSTLKYWLNSHPKTSFSNLYGPTEITVDCILHCA